MSTLTIPLYNNNNKISEWSRAKMGLGSGMKHGIQCCCLLSWVLLFTWWTEGLRFVHIFMVAPSITITSYHYLCVKQSSANSWQKQPPYLGLPCQDNCQLDYPHLLYHPHICVQQKLSESVITHWSTLDIYVAAESTATFLPFVTVVFLSDLENIHLTAWTLGRPMVPLWQSSL